MRRRRVDEPMKGVEKPTVRCPLAPQKVIAKGGAPLRSSGHVVARYRALPNESRLSCGAELEGSQGEFYHTARKTFSGSIWDGRRQLQALLGCAPQVIAGSCPSEEFKEHSPSLPWHLGLGCRVDRCSERTRPATPARKGTFTWTAP